MSKHTMMRYRPRLARGLLTVLAGLFAASICHAQSGQQRTVEVMIDDAGRLRPPLIVDDASTSRPPAPIGRATRIWADPEVGAILRQDADRDVPVIFRQGLDSPYGLAFDASTQSLVWTSAGKSIMQRLRIDTGEVEDLASSFDDPPVLELPREGGHAAITVIDQQIVRVIQDDYAEEPTVETLLALAPDQTVAGLALDAAASVVYVSNAVGMPDTALALDGAAIAPLIKSDNVPMVPDPLEPEPVELQP